MTRQDGPRIDTDYFLQGSPTNRTFAETMTRRVLATSFAPATTGVELSVAVVLQAGDIAANITFVTAGTAAVTPTAGYVCLRDSTGALITQSADFGSTARAANTAYTVALTTPYTAPAAGLYYVGISFTAGTVPTLMGNRVQNFNAFCGDLGLGAATLVKRHGSGVGGVAPATIVTPTTVPEIVYLAVT